MALSYLIKVKKAADWVIDNHKNYTNWTETISEAAKVFDVDKKSIWETVHLIFKKSKAKTSNILDLQGNHHECII